MGQGRGTKIRNDPLERVSNFIPFLDHTRIKALVDAGEFVNYSEFIRTAVKHYLDDIYQLRERINKEKK